MIQRDFELIPDVIKFTDFKRLENDVLNRILIIGPNFGFGCHFSENIHKEFVKEEYDVKIVGMHELNLTPEQRKRERRYRISSLLHQLKPWKPQLILTDECGVNFDNTQSIPVIHRQREFRRYPQVFHPTMILFWHEDIRTFFEKQFANEWCAQVQYREVMDIAVDPEAWKSTKKKYKGVCAFGGREGFKRAYDINELSKISSIRLLELEHEEFKNLEDVTYFEGIKSDLMFRDMLPQCEAIWVPVAMRQYTTRLMLEAMACKVLCIIKLENERHEEVLAKMDLLNGVHYIGVDKISEIPQAFVETTNKEEIIENGHEVVSTKHTYKNRMYQIIEKYNEIMEKRK